MSRMNTIHPANLTDPDDGSSIITNADQSESESNDLHREEDMAILRSKQRKSAMLEILNGKSSMTESIKHLFEGLTGILIALLISSIYTLLPWNDAIKDPQYFYETIIIFCLAFAVNNVAHWITLFTYATNLERIRTFQFYIEMWMILVFSLAIAFGILNVIWKYVWTYEVPVPLNGYMLYLIAVSTILTSFWIKTPTDWHEDKDFRKRFGYFFAGGWYRALHCINYAVMTGVLLSVSQDKQWIAAIFSPLIREFNIWVTLKIFARCSKGDMDSTTIFYTTDFGISHANFLNLTVGSIATFESTLVIIGVEFMINLFTCLRIIHLNHKTLTPKTTIQTIELLQQLIMNEWIEIAVPIGNVLVLLMGFYGPNKMVIGDIGCSYWQFNAIEDITQPIKLLSWFFIADLISLVITAYLLWKFCKINLYHGYIILKEEFGWTFAIILSGHVTGVII